MSNQEVYVIVPVKVQVDNGNILSVDPPDPSDVALSLKEIGSVQDKNKLLNLLNKFGTLAKSFLKTL